MEVLVPGTVLLGKYRVESVLRRGGMGLVVKVTHLHLGEELALKILLPEVAANPEVISRFLREARSVVRLRGEHVARVSDVGVLSDGAPYIAMEYLRGVDLAAELGRRRVLPPGEAVDYVLQACEALAEAHANDIVHRDIKPSNLFLTTRPDGTPLVKVLDFGISKGPVHVDVVTRTDMVMGTPGYMSTEQMKASKDVDGRSDIWSLGIVLYECLNGRRPFDGDSFSAIVLRAGTEPPPAMDPRIPRGLQAAVLRCLEKDRAARFPSIAALATALAQFARDQRAASVVVDRTKLIGKRVSAPLERPVATSPASAPTTLSGSVGSTQAWSSRRRWVRRGTVAAVVVLSITALAICNHAAAPVAPPVDVRPAETTATASLPTEPAGRGALVVDAAVVDVAVVDAAVADAAAAPIERDHENALKRACAEHMAAQAWQALQDCASSLAELGAKDKAKEYTAIAVREQKNELIAMQVNQLLRDRSLREARAALDKIDDESVYYVSLHDLFAKAENASVDAATRKAQQYASVHDCGSLRALYKELVTSSTPRIAAAIAAIKCTEKPSLDPFAAPRPEATRKDAGSGGVSAVSASQPPLDSCAKMNIDDVMEQASRNYNAGYTKSALWQWRRRSCAGRTC